MTLHACALCSLWGICHRHSCWSGLVLTLTEPPLNPGLSPLFGVLLGADECAAALQGRALFGGFGMGNASLVEWLKLFFPLELLVK